MALRERARWLEEETRRLGPALRPEGAERQGQGVSEEVLVRTRKILREWDGQLRHLGRELEAVGVEFEGWEEGRSVRR